MDGEDQAVAAEAVAASIAATVTTALLYLIGSAAVVFTTCYAYHWGI